jgi:hypothetical protein
MPWRQWCWVTAPCILDLGTRWKWVVSFMPWLLYSEAKIQQYTMDRRLGGLQSWYGHGSEEKKFPAPAPAPARKLNSNHPAHSLVTILTKTDYKKTSCCLQFSELKDDEMFVHIITQNQEYHHNHCNPVFFSSAVCEGPERGCQAATNCNRRHIYLPRNTNTDNRKCSWVFHAMQL